MGKEKRLRFHTLIRNFCDNVYYQPPSDVQLKYPCIIYNDAPPVTGYADDTKYLYDSTYEVMVIDRDPESTIGEEIDKNFSLCRVVANFTRDNLHHTSLTMHY